MTYRLCVCLLRAEGITLESFGRSPEHSLAWRMWKLMNAWLVVNVSPQPMV